MRKRLRGATFVAVTVASIVTLAGCGHPRTEAQKTYLTDHYRSLGRCTVNPKDGDRGAPFDPMKPASWRSPIHDKETWVRVVSWKITSKPKNPPQDRSVEVSTRLEVVRGDPVADRPPVRSFQQDAKSIAKALDDGLDVFLAIHPSSSGPYATSAIGFDTKGRVAWIGECASRSSDSAASRFEQAGVDPKVVSPAIRRWISNGDVDALVEAFARK
jgi:hypothetical protein